MYLVISYDFLRSNNVTIHSMTTDLEKAKNQFHIIMDWFRDYNKSDDNCMLVDMIIVEDEFFDKEGMTLYWGDSKFTNSKRLMTNNTDGDPVYETYFDDNQDTK